MVKFRKLQVLIIDVRGWVEVDESITSDEVEKIIDDLKTLCEGLKSRVLITFRYSGRPGETIIAHK
jgi:hypothetical protein